MRLTVNGQQVEVVPGDTTSCEDYLFLRVAGLEFFLMVKTPGLKKRDVIQALRSHPQLQPVDSSPK